jgi:hypothetical protein
MRSNNQMPESNHNPLKQRRNFAMQQGNFQGQARHQRLHFEFILDHHGNWGVRKASFCAACRRDSNASFFVAFSSF